jgi:hypothetical protein
MGRIRIGKRFRVSFLAAAAALLAVPLGFALSPGLEPRASGPLADTAVPANAPRTVAVPASIGRPATIVIAPIKASGSPLDDVSDTGKLFLVGTVLVGAAVAVRKAA